MKVCVYGCGAIGGLLAARLAAGGADTTVIGRGTHFEAIRAEGLTLVDEAGERLQTHPATAAHPRDCGPQDVVFLTMKAHALPAVADAIPALLGPDTVVVTAANGVPWWYFHGLPDDFGAPELASVDPGRQLWNAIGPERALGCVVYPAAKVEAPGVVRHVSGARFTLGEPDRSGSERLEAVAGLLAEAGFEAPMQAEIRVDIWIKLVANCAFNPVSVLTGKTIGAMIDDPATQKLLVGIMEEVTAVAHVLDVAVPLAPAHLIDATRPFGAHKTSMLQDFEAGRPLEIEPVAGAVLELAGLFGVAATNLATVCNLVRARAPV